MVVRFFHFTLIFSAYITSKLFLSSLRVELNFLTHVAQKEDLNHSTNKFDSRLNVVFYIVCTVKQCAGLNRKTKENKHHIFVDWMG